MPDILYLLGLKNVLLEVNSKRYCYHFLFFLGQMDDVLDSFCPFYYCGTLCWPYFWILVSWLFERVHGKKPQPFNSQGVPHWQVKSSGVRQSKIYKCQLALMGGKGLSDFWSIAILSFQITLYLLEKIRENLTLQKDSLRTLFHAPLHLLVHDNNGTINSKSKNEKGIVSFIYIGTTVVHLKTVIPSMSIF